MTTPAAEPLALPLLKANLAALKTSPDPLLDQRLSYVNGDFWGPEGKYWTGRRPGKGSPLTMKDVRDVFTPDDVIGPAVGRFVSGILGKDPEWDATRDGRRVDGDNPDPSLAPIEDAMTAWHLESELHDRLKALLTYRLALGGGAIRAYIPDVYASEATEGSQPDLAAALELVHLTVHPPGAAGPILDAHGREVGHFYRYGVTVDGVPTEFVEVHTPEQVGRFVWASGDLILAKRADGSDDVMPNPLYDPARKRRPRYLMHSSRRPAGSMLSPSVLAKQDKLSVTWTNLIRNSDLGGFRALYTTNAAPPEAVNLDGSSQLGPDGQPKKGLWNIAPDRVLDLVGEGERDPQTGKPTGRLATPGIGTIEPVPPSTFLETIAALKAALLTELDQGHVLEQYRAVSGDSKKESREAFEKRLALEAPAAAQALAWALETALGLAAWLVGPPADAQGVTFIPRLDLDISRGSLASYAALSTGYAQGTVSLEQVVASNPEVMDVAQELSRLAGRPSPRDVDLALKLAGAGLATVPQALEIAGFPDAAGRAGAIEAEHQTQMAAQPDPAANPVASPNAASGPPGGP